MSSTTSNEPPHNSHLLFIGQQCHLSTCHTVDFLPFRCDHCTHAFCADHYKPDVHSCEKYDAAKFDRVAPACPLCNTPVAIPPAQDPNVRMEQHIETECSVTTGRRTKPGNMPLCARGKCGKVLFAPIKCNSCNQQFCAAHRFPSAHSCSALATSSSSSKPQASSSTTGAGTRLANQTSAASAAAMAAMKRQVAAVKPKPAASASKANATSPPATSAPKKDAGSSTGNLFIKSKTDRRARAEQESRRRAMRERAKKGLLSEREQALLAEEEKELMEELRTDKKDRDCVVM